MRFDVILGKKRTLMPGREGSPCPPFSRTSYSYESTWSHFATENRTIILFEIRRALIVEFACHISDFYDCGPATSSEQSSHPAMAARVPRLRRVHHRSAEFDNIHWQPFQNLHYHA